MLNKRILITTILFVLLIQATFSQKLILTSGEGVEITTGDEFSGSLRAKSSQGVSNGNIKLPSNSGLNLGETPTPVEPTPMIPKGSTPIQNASLQNPKGQAIAIRTKQEPWRALPDSPETLRARNSVKQAKWITGKVLGTNKVIFWTPCFYNYCPKGEYSLHIESPCQFEVYLVDEDGKIVDRIGNGVVWYPYEFRFKTKCGKYRIKIVLNCPCGLCTYVHFNLYQDQTDCFSCPNDILHTYNPETCECECASVCRDCKNPYVWFPYPTCACGCRAISTSVLCMEGYYYDRRECRCKCLPKCCPWSPIPRPCGC